MDKDRGSLTRRRSAYTPHESADSGEDKARSAAIKASDGLPLPLWFTNLLFCTIFVISTWFLLGRWREKIGASERLHVLSWLEILAIFFELASFIYLIGFCGIGYVQNSLDRGMDQQSWSSNSDQERDQESSKTSCGINEPKPPKPTIQLEGKPLTELDDDTLAAAVSNGQIASHTLEGSLNDCNRAVVVRRKATEIKTGKSLEGLPMNDYDYKAILGACCELCIGYVQIPVGIAGPLLLNGVEYTVPMATTEGCLVASTNRGCKALAQAGGATAILLKDGMTRAPVVRFESALRAAELKTFLESPEGYAIISQEFNKMSRFARLQEVKCAMAGRQLFMRFSCSTGDAMGMNMVSKGVQSVLEYLKFEFPDMEIVAISGNFCADKKPTAVNWIEGRGKSIVCEAVIPGSIVWKVLKTSVEALVELNVSKNLVGSAMAGAMGGFNAHAANIVAAVFLATGQDPAQVVESSHCMTLMEAVNGGRDLQISVTMPCIEVGTVGGGTFLEPQAASLNLLGVKGANRENPGENARLLAKVVAGAVLAGELSLMSALAAGHLVKSHMKYNRSSNQLAAPISGASGSPPKSSSK